MPKTFHVCVDVTIEADDVEHAMAVMSEHFANPLDDDGPILTGRIDVHPTSECHGYDA